MCVADGDDDRSSCAITYIMYDHTVGMQLSYLNRIESRPSATGISGAILQCAEPALVYNPAREFILPVSATGYV